MYVSYLIPTQRVEGLVKMINKLAKRIDKGKTTADYSPETEIIREVIMTFNHDRLVKFNADKHDLNYHELYSYTWVTIKYDQPKLNGWSLVAVYDWEITDDGTKSCYTSLVPGQMMPKRYRGIEPCDCEHCGTNRARKQLMLVTKNHWDFKIVGSTCIKDFIGHHTPKSLIEVFSFEKTLSGMVNDTVPSSYKLALMKVKQVLELTAMFIRLDGYVKANDYDKFPTKEAVWSYIDSTDNHWQNFRLNNQPTATDIKMAEAAKTFALEQPNDTEYWNNIQTAINAGAISPKRIGLLCSVVYAYQKAEERRLKADVSNRSNEWLGTIKERLKGLTATVVRTHYIDGQFGTTTIINLLTSSGDTLVWFASGYHNVEQGEVWTLDGTVKDHNMYGETRQTVLSRVKYSLINNAEALAS